MNDSKPTAEISERHVEERRPSDKTTLSYAAIFGIKEDLALGKMEYQWLSSIFYYAFGTSIFFSGNSCSWLTLLGFPTNLLMQKFPIAKYLAVNIFFWDVLFMAQATVKDFKDMRILSGAAEFTADPAFVLITGLWYTCSQQPIRIALWYRANGIGIALGGLLGYAIGHVHQGHSSVVALRILVIGALCSFWALVMFTFVPDSPYYKSYWFKDEERLIVLGRKRHDQAGADTHRSVLYRVKPGQIVEAFCDPKIYLFFLLGFSSNIPNGGRSNFGTLIIQGFGFDTLETTLMQIPYGFFICFCTLFSVRVNSKAPKNSRTLLMVVFLLPNIISSYNGLGPETSKPTRLIGYWLTGTYIATFVLGLSLVSGNVGGQIRRAVANAAIFLGLCTGINIVGPFLFKTSEAPKYTTGNVFVILALRTLFLTSNKWRDRKMAEEGVKYDDHTAMVDDITDFENPAFRYVAVGSLLF
ncbi:MFS general substrate transporter [Armillaria nabsnona]|nr:MFS general substrate transporter [Armillaria nabsnona]